MKKTINEEVHVWPLGTPNFILVGENREPLPVNEFSEEEINELCQEFAKAMHAKRTKPSDH